MNHPPHAWLPDLVYTGKEFKNNLAVASDSGGRIARLAPASQSQGVVRLKNRALLPGLVNAHSHAFQRVIRGRTEHRTSNSTDSFWTWREMMYSAAERLTPEDLYDASRMAFMEMALSGITTVGEFHYLHNQPDGSAYDDPNLLAKQVVQAARDVGLRIALLRVAYARAGYQVGENPRQSRFIEPTSDLYLTNLAKLRTDLASMSGEAWVGVAPHSVRAVPLDYLKAIVEYGTSSEPACSHACRRTTGGSFSLYRRTWTLASGFAGERRVAKRPLHRRSHDPYHGESGTHDCGCAGDGVRLSNY